jgi:hypothetical protein
VADGDWSRRYHGEMQHPPLGLIFIVLMPLVGAIILIVLLCQPSLRSHS